MATYQALREDRGEPIPEDVKKIAVAVECFHKASLIHDDIEDEDEGRYGEQTLHAEHGIAVALNVGDLLIGEGYRLIGECAASDAQKTEMLLAASLGQRELSRGQGAELIWANDPEPLEPWAGARDFPPEDGAGLRGRLQLGASYAGKLDEVGEVLHSFSEALGIAYQIRDDLDDLSEDSGQSELGQIRPSILLAQAFERAKGEDKEFMEALWSGRDPGSDIDRIRRLAHETGSDEKCMLLLETYKETAGPIAGGTGERHAQGALRRVIGKIFNDLEIKGWCREYEVKNGVVRGGRAVCSEGRCVLARHAALRDSATG